MGLLDNQNQTPAQVTADQIRGGIAGLFKQMNNVYNQLYGSFWVDPVAVAAELGSDATELFRLSGLLVGTLNAAKAGTIPDDQQGPPDGYQVQPNQDGTVTITVPAPAEAKAK